VILISLILAALTFNPALAPHPAGPVEGYVSAKPIQPDFTCAPGGSH
jgi:hypothetical protein